MPATEQAISQIDKAIRAVRLELRGREKIDLASAASWQDAWDKHPELREREIELYRQRGVAQQARDEIAVLRTPPYRRAKKCPTCGCLTFKAAA